MKGWTLYDYTMFSVTIVIAYVVVYASYTMFTTPTQKPVPTKHYNSVTKDEVGSPEAARTSIQYNDAFSAQSKQMNQIDDADDASTPDVGSNWQQYILSQ
jgi:hypothetical protein